MEGERERPRRRRRWWAIGFAVSTPLVVVLGLALSYVFLVVNDYPLVTNATGDSAKRALGVPPYNARVIEYQDGQTFTVGQWVHNRGRFALTVTGVESTSNWLSMVKLSGARAGVVQSAAPCCVIDEHATWAAPGFTPYRLEPGKDMAIVMHFVLGNCEGTLLGTENSFNSVRVQFDEVGDHKTADVEFDQLIVVRYAATSARARPIPRRRATPDLPPRDPDVRHLTWLRDTIGLELVDAMVTTAGAEAYRRRDGVAVVPAASLGS